MPDPEVCPYCGRRPTGIAQDVYTDDHVFAESIGGRKTIRACKSCNDTFGHSFEAKNLHDTIIPLSMMLGRVGVPIALQDMKWKKELRTADGQVYDLSITPDGLQPQSAKPLVKRDPDDPKILQVTVNNDPESRKHLKQFSNPNKFRLESQTPGRPVRTEESTFTLNLNKATELTALKMAFASATLTLPDELAGFKAAALDLEEAESDSRVRAATIDHRTHESLDASRAALCHTIYVEEYEGIIHGIVQFFGSFQCWVKLSDSATRSYNNAILATLDPITGEETFRDIPSLGIRKWTGDEVEDQLSPIRKFNKYALERGATSDALKVTSVTGADGVEHRVVSSIPSWSWTGDMVGRKK
jgi:hypothetical protein